MLNYIDIDAIEYELEVNEELLDYSEAEDIEKILKEYMSDDDFLIENDDDEIINMLIED